MKTKVLSLVAMFILGTFTVFAGEKTEKFKVFGNCGMCEKTIEKAADSVDGVAAADWNKETKMIEVKFDDSKTSTEAVHKAIAKVGYDTKKYKAKDEVYNELPGCCKYDREEKADDQSHEGHQH